MRCGEGKQSLPWLCCGPPIAIATLAWVGAGGRTGGAGGAGAALLPGPWGHQTRHCGGDASHVTVPQPGPAAPRLLPLTTALLGFAEPELVW